LPFKSLGTLEILDSIFEFDDPENLTVYAEKRFSKLIVLQTD